MKQSLTKIQVFKGMGGAMDLISNPDATKIVVATDHVAKDGSPKVVEQCSLPLTGAKVVSTIITDLVSSSRPETPYGGSILIGNSAYSKLTGSMAV
jgi:hypothetical protein